jgi:hypothetical protein
MKYKSESDIEKIVRAFENGTIERDDWRHAEHLTVALYYVLHTSNLSDACNRMRAGIFNLLKTFGVDLEKEMPYHETLTVFWMQTVSDFIKSKNNVSVVDIYNELVAQFDKDYPLKFYSRELLFSDERRENFVEADLKSKTIKFNG